MKTPDSTLTVNGASSLQRAGSLPSVEITPRVGSGVLGVGRVLDTVHHGDSVHFLATLQDASVDAVISDVPFGTGTYKWDVEPSAEAWAHMRRISRGPIAIMAYGSNHLRWARHFDGMKCIAFIVWHKFNEPVLSPGLTREHQIVCVWGRSMKQVNAGAVRQPYRQEDRMQKYFGKDGIVEKRTGKRPPKHPDGARCSDVWKIAAQGAGMNRKQRHHPNQKPIDLMRRLVLLLTKCGDVILDPYSGSGSTLLAAKQEGRHYIGCDGEEKYVAISRERLASEFFMGGGGGSSPKPSTAEKEENDELCGGGPEGGSDAR